jgi:hypothetical protein
MPIAGVSRAAVVLLMLAIPPPTQPKQLGNELSVPAQTTRSQLTSLRFRWMVLPDASSPAARASATGRLPTPTSACGLPAGAAAGQGHGSVGATLCCGTSKPCWSRGAQQYRPALPAQHKVVNSWDCWQRRMQPNPLFSLLPSNPCLPPPLFSFLFHSAPHRCM